MELAQKTAKGLLWSGAQVWGGKALSFVVLVILSRLLVPENFGLVAYAMVFVSFAQIFLDQGFGDAIVQRSDLQAEHLDTAFWTNLLIGCLLTVSSIACASWIAELFRQPELDSIIQWLSLGFVISSLSGIQQALLRRDLAFQTLAIRSLFAACGGGAIGIGMAVLGFGVWSLVAQNLATATVGVLVLWNVCKWRPHLNFSIKHFRELFHFGINVIGINFLNFINRHADDFLIGLFLGPMALGFYTMAYRLLLVMTDMLTGVTNAVAFPAFSRIQDEPERMRFGMYQATGYTSLIAFPIFVGTALVAPDLITGLNGANWAPSIPVLQVLACIGILHSVFYFNHSVLLAAGKPAWRLGITLFNAIGNVIAFLIAVPYGIVAVAFAYVIRGYLFAPIEIAVVKHAIQINLRTYLGNFRVPLLSSLTMAVGVILVGVMLGDATNVYVKLAFEVLIGGIVYFASVWLIDPSLMQHILKLGTLVYSRKNARRAEERA